MQHNKPFLFTIILLEAFILFCLSVLGDRLASLLQLPTPLLLVFAVLGIVAIALLTYLRQSEPPADSNTNQSVTHLSLGEIWQRLKPHKRHKMLFGPRYSPKEEGIRYELSVGGAIMFGVLGSLLRYWFNQFGRSTLWYIMLGFFLLMATIPTMQVMLRNSAHRSFGPKALEFFNLCIFLGFFLLGGLVFTSILLYFDDIVFG